MSYKKQNFENGMTLTADHLNHIEEGIVAATENTSFTETDPTVPAWAKEPNKPTYTASEVGALPSTTKVPTKTSDLTNDAGFVKGSFMVTIIESDDGFSADKTPMEIASAFTDGRYVYANYGGIQLGLAAADVNVAIFVLNAGNGVGQFTVLPDKTVAMEEFVVATEDMILTKTSELTNDSEFVAKAFMVTVSHNGKTLVADKAPSEIFEAYNEGRYVYCVFDNVIMPLVGCSSHSATFRVNVGTFIQSVAVGDDKTANRQIISVVTEETDPTVPAWAKQAQKPSYTASEVGALPNTTKIPTKTSDLTNDSDFVAKAFVVNITTDEDANLVADKTLDEIIEAFHVDGRYVYCLWSGVQMPLVYVDNENAQFVLNAGTGIGVLTVLPDKTATMESRALVTEETDPTVPSWAKAANKPSYSKSEVGLGNVDNVKQYSASNPPPYPVSSVNGKTGVVTLGASDVGALPASTKIPTKTSQLTNDSGFIKSYTETDPTVPSWAKAASKPSYSKSEVGLGNVDNVKQYSASNPPPYPVTSVNGKTGAVTLGASDVGALPANTKIPSKTSELTNDSGFQTASQVTAIVQQQLGVIENGSY